MFGWWRRRRERKEKERERLKVECDILSQTALVALMEAQAQQKWSCTWGCKNCPDRLRCPVADNEAFLADVRSLHNELEKNLGIPYP
jgi:hypothetical protein